MRLFPVFGDQLSHDLASLRQQSSTGDAVVMMEVMEEATYVPHHPRKIALIFSAMRHFAPTRGARVAVRYVTLDAPDNGGSFFAEVQRAAAELGAEEIVATWPGEYRVLADLRSWEADLGLPCISSRTIVSSVPMPISSAGPRAESSCAEFFYRDMRRRTGLLMDGDQPVGEQWNFDADNRRKMPAAETPPAALSFEPDATTQAVLALVQERFAGHFGSLEGFDFPVTRAQALAGLADFIERRLPAFGDFQDAMRRPRGEAADDSLYHSLLGTSLNLGLLGPMEVCKAAEAAFAAGKAPLNAVEGFIRQIIGWREFVRGIYWLTMPGYAERNTFGADRPLPDFFWTGETDMACPPRLSICDRAYAHRAFSGRWSPAIGADRRAGPCSVNRWYSRLRRCLRVGSVAQHPRHGAARRWWLSWVQTLRGLGQVHRPHVGLLQGLSLRRQGQLRTRCLPAQCTHWHFRWRTKPVSPKPPHGVGTAASRSSARSAAPNWWGWQPATLGEWGIAGDAPSDAGSVPPTNRWNQAHERTEGGMDHGRLFGIGEALARVMARDGWRVYASARRADRLEAWPPNWTGGRRRPAPAGAGRDRPCGHSSRCRAHFRRERRPTRRC